MVWFQNHHDGWDLAGEWPVELRIEGLPHTSGAMTLRHYRIDGGHSNGYAEWVRQGRPMYPPPGQAAAIQARAGLELLHGPQPVQIVDGALRLAFAMPVHGVSLVVISG